MKKARVLPNTDSSSSRKTLFSDEESSTHEFLQNRPDLVYSLVYALLPEIVHNHFVLLQKRNEGTWS